MILKKKIFNVSCILLFAIVLLGSFLRLYNLGEKSFVADEFLGVNAVYGFHETGQFNRWDFNLDQELDDQAYPRTPFDFNIWKNNSESYIRAWIYNWQVAQTLKFLSPEKESTYRLVSALWGIALILFVYLVGYRASKKKKIGLIAAFFIAISPMSIEFSRHVRMYAMLAPIFLLFIFYLFKFLESEKSSRFKFVNLANSKTGFNFLYLPAAVLLGLLSVHLHLLTLNIFLVIFIYWCIMALVNAKKPNNNQKKYTAYIAISTALLIVLYLSFPGFKRYIELFIGSVKHFSYGEIIFSDYSSLILALVMILIGSFYLIKKNLKLGIFYSTVFWSIFILAVFFWNSNVGDRFIYFIKPIQVILLGSGIFAVVNFLRKNITIHSKIIYLAAMVLLMLAIPNISGLFGDNGPYIQTSKSSEPDYRKIFTYYMKKKKPADVLITRYFRNFYFKNAKAKVYSIGGERTQKDERRLDLDDIKEITTANKCGWMIYSDSDQDFITKEAQLYIQKNLDKIDNSSVRGPISVIRWCEDVPESN